MTPHPWIKNSQRVYKALLKLYPKQHLNDFGVSMLQVFTDQCRSAYQQRGVLGIILLWQRTLPDLGYTVLIEHISTPGARWGLMEPVPNTPLPWKGVVLVLLPGLVYLVGQIAQLTGAPWYLTIYYRAAFILILPALVVWMITRRFPIWGLIPIGLVFRLVQETGYQLIVLHPNVFSSNPLLNAVLSLARLVQQKLWIAVVFFGAAIILLVWRYLRQQKPSRSFWILTGMYFVVFAIETINQILFTVQYLSVNASFMTVDDAQNMLRNSITWDLYNFLALLLLIFIGTLFTRRHGFFAILIPMGYILPTVLVGMQDATDPTTALLIISIVVLAYRMLLSLVAPVWMARTGSQAGKIRVVIITFAIALVIQTGMQFYSALINSAGYFDAQWAVSIALDELKIISAIALGVVLYQTPLPGRAEPAQPVLKTPELPAEQA